MKEFKNSDLFRYDPGPSGGLGPGFHGGGGSNSGFQKFCIRQTGLMLAKQS